MERWGKLESWKMWWREKKSRQYRTTLYTYLPSNQSNASALEFSHTQQIFIQIDYPYRSYTIRNVHIASTTFSSQYTTICIFILYSVYCRPDGRSNSPFIFLLYYTQHLQQISINRKILHTYFEFFLYKSAISWLHIIVGSGWW